jgi:hypothetical protein
MIAALVAPRAFDQRPAYKEGSLYLLFGSRLDGDLRKPGPRFSSNQSALYILADG